MLSQAAILCFLAVGISAKGSGSDTCNPPKTLLGKFCRILFVNDFDGDGKVTNRDVDHGLIPYDADDDLCNTHRWEGIKGLRCNYGYSEGFSNYTFSTFDMNGDGVINANDLVGTRSVPAENYLVSQLRNLRDEWCRHDRYIPNPIDEKLCAEAETLKEEDLKCTFK